MQDLEINLIEVTKNSINYDVPYAPHTLYVHNSLSKLSFNSRAFGHKVASSLPLSKYFNILCISSKFLKSLSVIYSHYLKGSDRPYHLPNMLLRRTQKLYNEFILNTK